MKLIKFWPVVCIVFVWVIFSAPYFFKGQVPFPSAYQHNTVDPWVAYNSAPGPYRNGAMPDVISQIYPWKMFTVESLKHGQIPFWNPYSFSGTTHLANYQSAVLTPFTILFFIFPFVDAWSVLILLQPLLAGLFMYLFVRSLHVSKTGSVIASLSFMFCGFLTVWMAYGTLGYAILFLPLALFALEKYCQTKNSRFLLLLTATIPVSFFSGHFQTSLYFLMAIIAYGLWRMASGKRGDAMSYLPLAISILCGLLIAMPQILPSMEAYSLSLRSGLFVKGEVIPWSYLPTLFAPDVFGNPVSRNDWFGHYAEWNGYIGLLPLLFGLYAGVRYGFYRRTPSISPLSGGGQVKFFIFAGLVCLLLTLQTPVLDAVVSLHIPVLSTSAASRMIVLFSFFFAVVAGFGFDECIKDIKERQWKYIWVLFGGTSIVFGLLWICIIGRFFIPLDKVNIARQNLILPSLLFAAFLLLCGGGYVPKKELRHYHRIFAVIVVCLVTLDMLRFAMKWMPFEPKDLVFTATPVASFYKKIPVTERVFGNFGAENTVYYGISGIEGYDAVYNQRYGDFMKYVDKGLPAHSEKSLVVLSKRGLHTESALDVLNVRYVVHKYTDAKAPWTLPFWDYTSHMFTKVYDDRVIDVYRNEQALPRAWFTTDYIVERDEKKILPKLFSNNVVREKVVLEKTPDFPARKTKISPVKIIEYTPNKVTLAVTAHADGLVFLADNYYPGWRVFIDGKESELLRADYTFRAVRVQKGTHEIVFSYVPEKFYAGLLFAGIGLSGIISFLLVSSRKRAH